MNKDKKYIILALCCVALAIGGYFFWINKDIIINLLTDVQTLKKFIESFGAASIFVGVGIYALQIFVAVLPGEIVEVLLGILYGSWGGLAFCLVGHVIGSLFIFQLTKRYGMKFVQRFISEEKMSKINLFNDPNKLNALTFVLYLIPGTPKDLFTYVLGLTPMKCSTFLLITCVAKIPSIFTSTLVGANLSQNMVGEAVLIYVVTGVLSLIGYAIYRKKFA